MENRIFILILAFTLSLFKANAQSFETDLSPFSVNGEEKLAQFTFTQEFKNLGHNSEPWETTNYMGMGTFWINETIFLKQDTLVNTRGNKYASTTDLRNKTLLYQDYGEKSLMTITIDDYHQKLISTARYTPYYLLQKGIETLPTISENFAIYSVQLGKSYLKIFLDQTINQVSQISVLSYDELYGDVTTSYSYSKYKNKDNLAYPTSILIQKINGKVTEQVTIQNMKWTDATLRLLDKPEDYAFSLPNKKTEPEIKVTHYNDYIYFMDLPHTDDRVMLVEFEEYLLIAEAPINPKNGDLIIAEAKKIAPNKPIKYFIFGHHHPHYLGGLRSFVHEGSTILCTEISADYVRYIAEASHTLQPDNLELSPKPLHYETITDSLSIGKNQKMIIYFIGEKSAHTKDYLIYYFPNDNLLFQDDLCWIPNEGPLRKSGARQSGLYQSIIDLDLKVETIIQSWPVNSRKVKTIIPFSDLEKSQNIQP